ncbi:hypothetical protein [Oceanobacillus massiliensis]|uniref:hypothetical protein n=1 Tax=Oceanobacillus massiliensis TaxID=1465765 RepID=UPI000288E6AA|nr:hypothetical protein [Oceanobacillus massiliensis]
METSSQKKNTALMLSIAGGITLGWSLKTYLSKQQQLEEHQTIIQRLKGFEKRLYEDGRERAAAIEGIKQEVESDI